MSTDNEEFKKQIATAAEFISKEGTVSDSGSVSVTKSSYYDYMKTNHGIERSALDATADAERALTAGAIDVATTALEGLIKKAKDAGEATDKLDASVTISRPTGALITSVFAERTNNNPRTREQMVSHGVVRVRVRTKAGLDKGQLESVAKRISDLS